MHRFTNLTAWNDGGSYFWASLSTGPKHGPFRSFNGAQDDARRTTGKSDLLLYGSCPDRFCRAVEPTHCGFTQEMAETYGDARD